MLHETETASIPSYIEVAPGLVEYDYRSEEDFVVTVSNITTNTVSISPRAILCELQPVTVTEETLKRKEEDLDRRRREIVDEMEISKSNVINEEQVKELKEFLMRHKDIFSTGDTDIGNCNKVQHAINLVDETPFKLRHRRIPTSMIREVREHLEQLQASRIIRPSKSPYASPIVLCKKKNGQLRMCIDFRALNQKTIKDSYALPRLEEVFDVLNGAKYFSTVDMKSGYYQVEVKEEHKERTAFTLGPYGLWEFNKLPFGLTNSPATYQRLMQECLGNLNMNNCVVYIDDLIIFSKTFEEHIENLEQVFSRLSEFGLKLAPEKCKFCKRQVSFLGHVVSDQGIETDPEKIEKVVNWPTPTNPEEVRSFLGFAGYYRRFVKDFSKVTRPLAELMPPTSGKKNQKKQVKHWKWTQVEDNAFKMLKELLSSPPILAYPDFTLPFEVHTDASTIGLGAVLYQEQEGTKRVISYASRALNKSEKNYSAYRLEFLALKWAVTEKFSDYLCSNHFTVWTDCNPLTYVMTTAKLDATGQRWASALGQFSFDMKYRSGLRNADADGLSRYPHERNTEAATSNEDIVVLMDKDAVQAICKVIVPPYLEVLPCNSVDVLEVTEGQGQTMAQKEMREIRQEQRKDKMIDRWRIAVIDKKLPKKIYTSQDLAMKKQFANFKMKRGILFRTIQENNKTIEQLVLPEGYKEQVLNGLHNEVGHPGKERTMKLLRERFYWPGMTSDVEKWVGKCDRCLRRKTTTKVRAPLVNVHTTYPLELVCFDYLTLEPSKGGISNVLVITDHFTKYAMAVPTRNQTAKTTAETFYNEFIVHYGIPTRLHSDQGANFESELIRELCNLMGTKKSRTSIYHPQGNAGPERFNRTLLNMLGTLENSQKADWKKYVSSLVYAYNCTPHESTKMSPFELMFGRQPKLPIDAVFEKAGGDVEQPYPEYIKNLKEKMAHTREIVKKHTDHSKQKQKKFYDLKAKGTLISPGDKVLVKVLAFKGKHKIADLFEEELYTVKGQTGEDIPVFNVEGDVTGTRKTLHRNHLSLVKHQEECENIDNEIKQAKPAATDSEKTNTVDGVDGPIRYDSMSDVTKEDEDEDAGQLVFITSVGDAQIPAQNTSSSTEEHSVAEEIEGGENDGAAVEIPVDITSSSTEEHSVAEEIEGGEIDVAAVEIPVDNTSSSIKEHGEAEGIEGGEKKDTAVESFTECETQEGEEHYNIESDQPGQVEDTAQAEVETTTPSTNMIVEDEELIESDAPKRPVRERKRPKHFENYQMFSMVPADPSFQALNQVLGSGVLQLVDVDIAKRLITSIFQKD